LGDIGPWEEIVPLCGWERKRKIDASRMFSQSASTLSILSSEAIGEFAGWPGHSSGVMIPTMVRSMSAILAVDTAYLPEGGWLRAKA